MIFQEYKYSSNDQAIYNKLCWHTKAAPIWYDYLKSYAIAVWSITAIWASEI